MEEDLKKNENEARDSNLLKELSSNMKELFESTSMHGLGNIAANESIFFKLIWIVLVFVGIGLCAYCDFFKFFFYFQLLNIINNF